MENTLLPLAYSARFDVAAKAKYDRLVARSSWRDRSMELVRRVRNGDMRALFPAELELNLSFNGVPIANFVDIVAHDVSELIAPLPSVRCISGRMHTDADQKRAETKNRIADSYWIESKLAKQMFKGADRYVSYGFLPFFVEPDLLGKRPFIQVDDPRHAYYELDRFGQVVVYAKMWMKTIDELCSMFPELAQQIRGGRDGGYRRGEHGETQMQMVRWVDRQRVALMLPERNGMVLTSYEHKLDRAPAYIVERSGGVDDAPRGQFDDVIWVQVARAIMTTLSLEAASEAVTAPLVLPEGMDEIPLGPHSVLQGPNADQAKRLNLELPPGVFQENMTLQEELQQGSRYPDARTGNSNASVITGKGVEALLGSFTTQIAAAQAMFKDGLENVTAICFQMDEMWWPHDQKLLQGTQSGTSYEFQYTPADDIAGKYKCTVTYGFAAGMQPAQSVVTMLQLQGAGAIAHKTLQENLPFDVDAVAESRQIDVEDTRNALKQGLFQLVSALGPMTMQGQDPTQIVSLVAQITKDRQDGKSIEDAALDAFATYAKAQQAAQAAAQQAQAEAAGGQPGADPGQPGGGGDAGALPEGVAQGQAGLPPGGRPTVQNMLAGFRGQGNSAVLQDVLQRRVPTTGQ